MFSRKTLIGLLLAGFVLAAPGFAWAQDAHSEADAHPDTYKTHTLSLNEGEKWETDAPLRQGMTGIRIALARVGNRFPSELSSGSGI